MKSVKLNEKWRFRRLPEARWEELSTPLPKEGWEAVNLPHTWFSEEEPWQGITVYEKTIRRAEAPRAFLSFDNADQVCRVYVNGDFAGEHRGGYSRFRLPVPEAARQAEEWVIRVFLDNRVNEDIAPSFGDFTVFGGLYRGAELLEAGEVCFDPTYYGTDGLIIRTRINESGQGILEAEPHVLGDGQEARIRYTLRDAAGRTAGEAEGCGTETVRIPIEKPELWDGPGKAALYTLTAELRSGGKTADQVTLRTGFRKVELDGQKGLFLNGRAHQLRGAARHQDRAEVYPAASAEQIREDFGLIREMGANAVRLSHYQHPQAAYDCCDEEGLLCWAEIPMLKMTESAALMENAEQQLTELILQNNHHPSIFCWGIQNEIAMFRDAPYMHENCRKLHELVKRLDPGRASTAANLYPLKARSRLNEITDMVGYNVYFGWYYGEIPDYGPWLDKFHAARPDLPFGISEYGVDANLKLHSEDPKVKDYSEEYQSLWHEKVYPQIEARPWLWGSYIWNMFDFSSVRRNEGGQKYLNAKGLITHDRKTRKDAFYYYKARWTETPFVHLCAKRFRRRAQEKIEIKCYTNQPFVRLTVNGEDAGEARTENGTAVFRGIRLRMGENRVTAAAGDCRDEGVWERTAEPEPEYRLPDAGAGTAVKNWFLEEDTERREGYFSVQDTANDLLENPESRRVLEKYIPGLVRVMTERSVIPLGLALKSILAREKDGSLDVRALNGELNRIPNE